MHTNKPRRETDGNAIYIIQYARWLGWRDAARAWINTEQYDAGACRKFSANDRSIWAILLTCV